MLLVCAMDCSVVDSKQTSKQKNWERIISFPLVYPWLSLLLPTILGLASKQESKEKKPHPSLMPELSLSKARVFVAFIG